MVETICGVTTPHFFFFFMAIVCYFDVVFQNLNLNRGCGGTCLIGSWRGGAGAWCHRPQFVVVVVVVLTLTRIIKFVVTGQAPVTLHRRAGLVVQSGHIIVCHSSVFKSEYRNYRNFSFFKFLLFF